MHLKCHTSSLSFGVDVLLLLLFIILFLLLLLLLSSRPVKQANF